MEYAPNFITSYVCRTSYYNPTVKQTNNSSYPFHVKVTAEYHPILKLIFKALTGQMYLLTGSDQSLVKTAMCLHNG